MGTRSYKAGLVGCGHIGALYDEKENGPNRKSLQQATFTHSGMYAASERLKLTCAMDSDAQRLAEFGQIWNISSLYSDLDEMLTKQNIDILSIASPDHCHELQLQTALKSGNPRLIFTEKPIAQSAHKAKSLCKMAEEKEIILVVDYVRRFDRVHAEIRDYLRSGKLGQIQNVTGYYVRGLLHNGCQLINLLRYFFGPIAEVQASPFPAGGSQKDDPSLDALLRFENETRANILGLDRQGYSYSMFELDIFGTKGRLRLGANGQCLDFFTVEQHPDFPNFQTLSPGQAPWGEPSYNQALGRCGRELTKLLDGTLDESCSSAWESVADLTTIEAIRQSAQTGHAIAVATPYTNNTNS